MRYVLMILALTSTMASADSMRSVETNNLSCEATAGRTSLRLFITAGRGVTKLRLVKGRVIVRDILNREDLVVGSEGNVYIQQVSNELGYNLMLSGEGLEQSLN